MTTLLLCSYYTVPWEIWWIYIVLLGYKGNFRQYLTHYIKRVLVRYSPGKRCSKRCRSWGVADGRGRLLHVAAESSMADLTKAEDRRLFLTETGCSLSFTSLTWLGSRPKDRRLSACAWWCYNCVGLGRKHGSFRCLWPRGLNLGDVLARLKNGFLYKYCLSNLRPCVHISKIQAKWPETTGGQLKMSLSLHIRISSNTSGATS